MRVDVTAMSPLPGHSRMRHSFSWDLRPRLIDFVPVGTLRRARTAANAAVVLATVYLLMHIGPATGTERSDGLTFGGVRLTHWQQRLVDFDAKSPAAARAVEPLMAILADERVDDVTRRNAAIALGNIGEPAGKAAPQLALMIADDENPKAALWAAKALSLMGSAARDATPELVRIVGESQQPLALRQLCMETLGRIAGAHPDAVPALVRVLGFDAAQFNNENERLQLRTLAVEAVGVAGTDAAVAGPMLVRILRDPREPDITRRAAAISLGRIGERATVAAGALAETVAGDDSPAVRDEAAKSLAALRPQGTAMLLRFLARGDDQTRWRAALGLGEVNRADAEIQATLFAALDDSSQLVQLQAAQSLLKVGAGEYDVLPRLLLLLQSEDRSIRRDAMEEIVALDEDAARAVSTLRILAESQRAEVARIAELTLRRIHQGNVEEK